MSPIAKRLEQPWIDVGSIDEIPRRGARVIETDRGSIALFRTSDDCVFAIDDRCPHLGGPLSQGIVHGARVTCPLHAWTIELDSGRASAPDVGCTMTYGVKVVAGIVYLALEVR